MQDSSKTSPDVERLALKLRRSYQKEASSPLGFQTSTYLYDEKGLQRVGSSQGNQDSEELVLTVRHVIRTSHMSLKRCCTYQFLRHCDLSRYLHQPSVWIRPVTARSDCDFQGTLFELYSDCSCYVAKSSSCLWQKFGWNESSMYPLPYWNE